MSRAVDVRIVTLCGLILKVTGVDRNTARFLFWRVIDFIILHDLVTKLASAVHGDGGAERRLSVVNVSDRTDVHVRFGTLEFLFGHISLLLGFVTGDFLPHHRAGKNTVRRQTAVGSYRHEYSL